MRWGWRLFKGLLSLALLALVALGLHAAQSRSLGGLGIAAFAALALLALWAELLGEQKLQRLLPWPGLFCGTALILGAPQLASTPATGSACKALCGISLLLSAIGGPLLAGLPYALLGALTVYLSVKALRKRP